MTEMSIVTAVTMETDRPITKMYIIDTEALLTLTKEATDPYRPEVVIRIVIIVFGLVGIVGNAGSLLVTFKYGSVRLKLGNRFIVNQCIVDLIGSAFLVFTYLIMISVKTYMGAMGGILCRVFMSEAMVWMAYQVSTLNLVALTIERYLKIVHPILHQRTYTKTVAYGSMASLWLCIFFYKLMPNVMTTGSRNGACLVQAFWPSATLQRAYGISIFVTTYLLPMAILLFCYGHILYIVRRSFKAVSSYIPQDHIDVREGAQMQLTAAKWSQSLQLASGPSASSTSSTGLGMVRSGSDMPNVHPSIEMAAPGGANPRCTLGVPQRGMHATGALSIPPVEVNNVVSHIIPPATNLPQHSHAPKPVSKGQMEVLKTFVLVSIAFVICWSPTHIYYLMYNLGTPIDFTSPAYYFTMLLSTANTFINPFIYLAKFDDFKQGARFLLSCKMHA